jgi:DnaJ-class molecular chaperone
MRLGAKGMPHARGRGYGDEYVRLIGLLPKPLTQEEKDAFREFAKLHPDMP